MFVPKLRRWSEIIVLAAVITVLDLVSGTYIKFPVAFVLPVYLMGWQYGRAPGIWLAWAMLTARFIWNLQGHIGDQRWLQAEVVNTLTNMSVLVVLVYLVDQTKPQDQERSGLHGLLPICAHCKMIRNEQNEWEQIEEYIAAHSDAAFSHSICPDCMRVHWHDVLSGRYQKQVEKPHELKA